MHFHSEAREFDLSPSQRSSEPRSAKSTHFQVSNSLFKGFVGIGVLTLPYGIHQTGIILGILLMMMGGVFTFWSINLLVVMIERQRIRVASYAELGRMIGGGKLGNFIEILVIMLQVGACLAYLYYVKEIVKRVGCRVLGDEGCEEGRINNTILICLTLAVLLPFSCIRTMTRFSHVSFIGNLLIISSLLLALLLMVRPPSSSPPTPHLSSRFFSLSSITNSSSSSSSISSSSSSSSTSSSLPSTSSSLPSASSSSYRLFEISGFGDFFGVALFSIESMGVVIEIRDSMIEPKEFPKVFKQQFWTIFALYTILPTGFYLAYGEGIKEIVLFNLPNDNLLTNLSQILYCFGLLISFNFQIFPIYFLIDRLIDSSSHFFPPPSSFSTCSPPLLLPTSSSIPPSTPPPLLPPSSIPVSCSVPPPHLPLLPPSFISPSFDCAPSPSSSDSPHSLSSRFFRFLSLSPKVKKIIYRMFISLFLVLVSDKIPDLVWILNVLGAVGSTLLGMIIPVILAEIYFIQGKKRRGRGEKEEEEEEEEVMDIEKEEKGKEEEEEGKQGEEEDDREEEGERKGRREDRKRGKDDYSQGTRILNIFTMMIGVGGGAIAVANSLKYFIGKP